MIKKNYLQVLSVIVILIAAAIVGACSQAPTPVEPVPVQETPQEQLAYPAPGEDVVIQAEESQNFQDGDEILWNEAETIIMRGVVESVIQTHDLKVTLVLKDGRRLFTEEPEIDEVIKVIGLCGDLCANVRVATE
jgi:hypothetical protein